MIKNIVLIFIVLSSFLGCNKKATNSTTTDILTTLDPTFSAPTELTYSGLKNQELKVNQLMTSIVPTYLAKSNVVLFRVSPALPSGLSIDPYSGVISGIPLVMQDQQDYTISVINNGGYASYDITIKIDDVAPSALQYSQSKYTIQLGTDGSGISPSSVSGGTVVSYSINPTTLPAGMSFSTDTGEIFGRPFVSMSETSYTITATNSGGSTSTSLKLEVVGFAPSNLSYQQPNVLLRAGKDSLQDSPLYSGDTATAFTVSPALPDDLNLDISTGLISGNPSVASNGSYTITATNKWGSTTSLLKVISLNYINGLSTGENHSCVLKNKNVYCFGKNDLKQLGNDSTDICVDALSSPTACSKTPLLVKDYFGNPMKIKKIVSGLNSNCVLTNDLKVACFGSNLYGQLGFGSSQLSNKTPTLVVDESNVELSGVTDIQSGANHFCAQKNNKLYCWGDNQNGQLGRLILLSSNVAIPVKNGNDDLIISNFGLGMNHSCANSNNSLYCWGLNTSGQLSLNDQQSTNSPTLALDILGMAYNPSLIIGGGAYSLIKDGIYYKTVGLNEYGELSNGTMMSSFRGIIANDENGIPLSTLDKVVPGNNSFCFLKQGFGYCVGRNDYNFGNLTNLNIGNVSPIQILDEYGLSQMSEITELSSGFSSHRCLAKKDIVYCFGKNTFGQLGTNYIDSIFPKIVVIP